jgi:VCBS repeat-containing protein
MLMTRTSEPYDVTSFLAGNPVAYAQVLGLTFVRAVNFPSNFSGSVGSVGTNPTASAVYTVKRNGSSVGTVTISTSGTFTFSTSGAVSFASGDRMTIVAPSVQDATLADVAITLAGTDES